MALKVLLLRKQRENKQKELETLRDTVQHFVRVMNADADTGPHDRGPRGKIERSG